MSIAIAHSAADGTVLTGDPRPHHQLCKDAGMRYSRNIPGWYLPHSRDRAPRVELIERLAGQLRDVGFDVTVSIDTDTRPAAERYADEAERLAARQDGLDAKAEHRQEQAAELLERAHGMADAIPFGQPILVGHHSERRDRNYRERIGRTFDRGFETLKEAQETARRAEASRARQEHRESAPAMIRKVRRLEAELRDIDRKVAPCSFSGRAMKPEADGRTLRCPACYQDITIGADLKVPEHWHNADIGGADREWHARLRARRAVIVDEVAYLNEQIDEATTTGDYRQLGPSDFTKGDRVIAHGHPGTVVRVNKKSLTVAVDVMPQFPRPVPYDQITLPEEAPCPTQ